jgi:hypothetical protein
LNRLTSEFFYLTQSLLTHVDIQTIEHTTHLLKNIVAHDFSTSNLSLVNDYYQLSRSRDLISKIFDKRPCQMPLPESFWLQASNFIYSVTFSFNRHTLAIFFGNALPSFTVLLANLLSIKVIYCSKSLRYLKQANSNAHRKSRVQYDLRAFLVILVESCSIIMISWGIPISLTMYHCHTLYVESISTCPKIKDYLALFLFIDLFNSSSNCLLYSLSGKIFRRKFLSIIQLIFTCGRGSLWHVKQHSLHLAHQPLMTHMCKSPSSNIDTNYRLARQSDHASSLIAQETRKHRMHTLTTMISQSKHSFNDVSFEIDRTSIEQNNGTHSFNDIDELNTRRNSSTKITSPRQCVQTIRTFLLKNVRSLGLTGACVNTRNIPVRRSSSILIYDNGTCMSNTDAMTSKSKNRLDLSRSKSASTNNASDSCQQRQQKSPSSRYGSKIIVNSTMNNSSTSKVIYQDNLTSL